MVPVIECERLVLRPWTEGDAPAALSVYGTADVALWLTPAMDRVVDLDQMRAVLRHWAREYVSHPPTGHWAVELCTGHRVVGGCSLGLIPGDDTDVQPTWALAPSVWGRGYATEAGAVLTRWAVHEAGLHELFALMQRNNPRAAATAMRIGMEWVRETGRDALQVYRIRHADRARIEPVLGQADQ